MEKKLGEMCDPFLADIRPQGSLMIITVPKRMMEFMGWKLGMELRVMAQEVKKVEGGKE